MRPCVIMLWTSFSVYKCSPLPFPSGHSRVNSKRMMIESAPTGAEYRSIEKGSKRRGRQIQPLACVSRSGSETGVCMFAWTCVEAGGKHLGTCIDRFYFGSCCQLPSNSELPLKKPQEGGVDADKISDNEIPDENLFESSKPSSTFTPSSSSSISTESTSSTKVTKPVTTTSTTTTTSFTTYGTSTTTTTTNTTSSTTSMTTTASTTTTSTSMSTTTMTVTTSTLTYHSIKTTNATASPPTYHSTTTTLAPLQTTTESFNTITENMTGNPSKDETTSYTSDPTTKPTTTSISPATTTLDDSSEDRFDSTTSIQTDISENESTANESIDSTTTSITSTQEITTDTTIQETKESTTVSQEYRTEADTEFTVENTSEGNILDAQEMFTVTEQGSTIYEEISTIDEDNGESTANALIDASTTCEKTFNTESSSITMEVLDSTTEISTNAIMFPQGETTEAKIDILFPQDSTYEVNIETEETSPNNDIDTSIVFPNPSAVTAEKITDDNQNTTESDTVVIESTDDASDIGNWIAIKVENGQMKPIEGIGGAEMKPGQFYNCSAISQADQTFNCTIVTGPGTTNTSVVTSNLQDIKDAIQAAGGSAAGGEPIIIDADTVEGPNAPLGEPITPKPESNTKTSTSKETDSSSVKSPASAKEKPLHGMTYKEACGRQVWLNASYRAQHASPRSGRMLKRGPGKGQLDLSSIVNGLVDYRGSRRTGKIVNGDKAEYGEWPWQVSLRQWRTATFLHKCGAALLSENWAITAAHCVESVNPDELLLRMGEYDLNDEYPEPYTFQDRKVQIVASHPKFDPKTFEYDLALLRFYEPVTFQPNIIPICVPEDDDDLVGRDAWVTGWGRLYEDGPLPAVLQEVPLPIINNKQCEQMYEKAGFREHIPHIFICAGYREGGRDSCEGDSGGPMVAKRGNGRYDLAGVISWGIGCAKRNQPGAMTRIAYFRDWINTIIKF